MERGKHGELEQRLLEATLRQQQIQSEEDSRWLHQEENNLVSISFLFLLYPRYLLLYVLTEEKTLYYSFFWF